MYKKVNKINIVVSTLLETYYIIYKTNNFYLKYLKILLKIINKYQIYKNI